MSFLGLGDALREEPAETPSKLSLELIFTEEPVPLDVFIKDKKFLNNPPLSPVQYDAVRHIERVYYPELYPLMGEQFNEPYWTEPIRMVNLITLQWGKGSGKDHICRMASLRVAYLLLCLRSPQAYYEMPEQDTITMLNIASSATQAMRAFFVPMTRAVKRGWFEDKCDPKQNVIVYDKNIEAVSGHSDAESQEGGNLILGIADEIDAFRSKDELERYRGNAPRESPRSAEAILKMMRTSSSTRFPKTYKNVRISYPRYLGSTIQKLTATGKADIHAKGENKSRHYVSGPLATWEVNPRVSGKDDFQEDYDEDPDMAAAMYECKPTRATDTYFKNMEAVRLAVDADEQPIDVDYEVIEVHSQETGRVARVWNAVFGIDSSFVPRAGSRYAIHADLALSADSAGVSMSHVESWQDHVVTVADETGFLIQKTERRPVVRTDFVIRLESDMSAQVDGAPPREIQIRWVRALVFQLIQLGFSIDIVTYDGFQSADSMQILNSHGVETARVSTDRDQDIWKSLKDLMYEGRLRMPFSAKLLEELESLGKRMGKVDHPPGGSKDEADALACSVWDALSLGGESTDEQLFPTDGEFRSGGWADLSGVENDSMMSLPLGFSLGRPM